MPKSVQADPDQLKLLLEGVVEFGTAKNLKNADYRIAGKPGRRRSWRMDGIPRSTSLPL